MKARIGNKEVKMQRQGENWIPDATGDFHLQKIGRGRLLITINGETFTAHLLDVNKPEKQVRVMMNGKKHLISLREPLDDLLHDMGLDKAMSSVASNIKAPMPGLVLDVAVEPGSAVNKGDKMLVLEAMKMENVIKAGGEGTVARVLVQKGQTVDKNQILIEFV